MRRILRMTAPFIACVLAMTGGETVAGSRPAQITWDWFRAGEAYKRYPKHSPEDLRIAAHYHRLAAEHGNAASAYKLAEMYENGVGVPQDYATARHWYEVAAGLGDRYAPFRLGLFHQKGMGVDRDAALALVWYERAAKLNDAWAYHMMAFMYADGEGVAKDEAMARRYFEISLPRTGDPWAKWRLALILKPLDPKRATKLLREAAAAGNIESIRALGAAP